MSTTIDPTVAPATAATAVDTTTAPTLAFTDVAKVFATGTRALEGVSIDDNSGIISYNYSNGQTVQKWKIPIVAFNGASYLKAEDGGAYTETIQSGSPIEIDGALSSSALEASNVDISEEFTKLIVTQQAFSANSKVITTSDSMMSDILNIIR